MIIKGMNITYLGGAINVAASVKKSCLSSTRALARNHVFALSLLLDLNRLGIFIMSKHPPAVSQSTTLCPT